MATTSTGTKLSVTATSEDRRIRHPASRQALSSLSLDYLLLLIHIVETSGIAPAARMMGISASNASRKLQDMEAILGVRLMERTTRSLEPTEAGALVYDWSKATMASYYALSDTIETTVGSPRGLIRVAVNSYVASTYLPAILEEFGSQYPKIDIEIRSVDRAVDLISEHQDVAIYSGPNVPTNYIGIPIGTHHRVICASKDYLDRFGEPKSPKDLQNHRIIVHSTAESRIWGFFNNGAKTTETIKPYVVADTHMMLRDLACRGMGIVRLGYLIVKSDIHDGRLQVILNDYQSIYEEQERAPSMWVLYPNRNLPYRVRVFVDLVIKMLNHREHLGKKI